MSNKYNAYTKEEIIEKLKLFYKENNVAITYTKIKKCNYMPTIKVFDRIFGSLKNACLESGVPFSREECIKRKSMVDTKKRDERILTQKYNNQGCLMTCIEYQDSHNITVKFEDEYGAIVKSKWRLFDNGSIDNPNYNILKIGEENYNKQGCLMRIVEYNNTSSLTIEFQDEFKFRKKTTYTLFKSGSILNPFHKSVYNIGIVGNKYPIKIDGKTTKEYYTWSNMLKRCYSENVKKIRPTYKNVTCCEEWLYYPNFYEWLHSQENFDEWKEEERGALDKDILIKGNKHYSPTTCCLVPDVINSLLVKCDSVRGELPIGVFYDNTQNVYVAQCCENAEGNYIGSYSTCENAFNAYKKYKENVIKKTATREFNNGTITKKCYDALLKYEVEITD